MKRIIYISLAAAVSVILGAGVAWAKEEKFQEQIDALRTDLAAAIGRIDTLEAALAAETAARVTADAALQAALDAEEAARC
jgi:hypothetical protein